MLVPLASLIPALCVLAVAVLAARAHRARLAALGTFVLAALGLGCTLAWMLAAPGPSTVTLPFGLPGAPLHLALDVLTAPFLLILFTVALLAGLFGIGHAAHDADAVRSAPFLPAFVAAMLLALLAGDGFSLLAGFEAMSLLSWPLVLGRGTATGQDAGRLYLGVAAFSGACLIPAIGLFATIAESLEFARIRVAPPEGWQAGLVLCLTLLGAGSKAGLVPLHPWLPPAHAAAPAHASALMSGAMTKIAVYVLVRLLFDLAGPAQPWWWGGALMVLGAASVVLGAVRAMVETDVKVLLAASTIENIGLIAICLGLALAFRSADASTYASLALGAGLLHAVNHAAFKSLLFLGSGGVMVVARARSLEALGGLLVRAPVLGTCMLVGCLSAAALPPWNGFASEWLAFQAVLAAPRQGSLGLQIGASIVAGAMALGAAIAAAAFVRLFGIAFLSRPRSAGAAAASDLDGPMKAALLAGSLLCVLLGLVPLLPLLAVDPAVRALAEGSIAAQAGWLAVVAPGSRGGGYAPLPLLFLVLLTAALMAGALRLVGTGRSRRAPLWACGFPAALPNEPLPTPLAQVSAAGYGQPLRRIFGTTLLAAREQVDVPAPGATGPARYRASLRDPGLAWLLRPVDRAVAAIAAATSAHAPRTIRRHLVVLFGWLVAVLAALAVLAEA